MASQNFAQRLNLRVLDMYLDIGNVEICLDQLHVELRKTVKVLVDDWSTVHQHCKLT